jgi:N-methylhydantoinase A
MSLDRRASAKAIERLASTLAYGDHERLAEGVMKLAVARMASAIREISIERGHDPRGFALVPLGGAGPMHAAELAEELGVNRVLVPRFPGNLSAVGLIGSDIRHDFGRTLLADVRTVDMEIIRTACAELVGAGRAVLTSEGFVERDVRIECSGELRYRGQAFDVNVPFDPDSVSGQRLCADFEERYEQRYGHRRAGKPIDIVTIRVVATGVVERPKLAEFPRHASSVAAAEKTRRPVYFNGEWHRDCAVYDRAKLGSGAEFAGPAVVEEYGSTTAIPPGWGCGVDGLGNLRIERS